MSVEALNFVHLSPQDAAKGPTPQCHTAPLSGDDWGPLGTTPTRATGISWGINYLEVKKKPLGLVNHPGCAKQKATLSAAATADLR